MSKDITVREDGLSPEAVQARKEYATALSASNLLPDAYRGKPANVLVAVEMGNALGLRPIAALSGISVIKGKPCLSADLMASVVRNAGHKLRIQQKEMAVKATLIRADDPDFEFSVIWDQERAQRAGLWGQKGPWSQYPEQMLRSRAITEVCRQGASDCLFGAIYSPEEIQSADNPVAPAISPQEECQAIVREHVRNYGGDPKQLRDEWVQAGGKADPAKLAEWLATNKVPTNDDIVDAEIIEEEG